MIQQTIKQNLKRIRERIAAAAHRVGRSEEEIKLVAVTKYVDSALASALVNAGQNLLGESRPQALWEKAEQLADLEVQWDFIGHLQRNKVNRTIPYCRLIHSVDSLRLLQAINVASETHGIKTSCLIEINISGEESKHGLKPEELGSFFDAATDCGHVQIDGLMGMASLSGDLTANRNEFRRLHELLNEAREFKSDNIQMTELSMGMSRDFEIAIEEGATIVRIGSVLYEGLEL